MVSVPVREPGCRDCSVRGPAWQQGRCSGCHHAGITEASPQGAFLRISEEKGATCRVSWEEIGSCKQPPPPRQGGSRRKAPRPTAGQRKGTISPIPPSRPPDVAKDHEVDLIDTTPILQGNGLLAHTASAGDSDPQLQNLWTLTHPYGQVLGAASSWFLTRAGTAGGNQGPEKTTA